ncbi:MAG: hypothetical protein UV61_C0008G0072 [Candidatus Gottesmanbacteria bacterium GW2011_GWB1_43_11]|uniref:Uncharacterized protein n=1 Tax=Candidatus Gottesmanbacteria bacterium GW2011_GWB1_43_11 TaxID=1618446 RepID=A0A0G1CM92_9BACT|nr:MAG: hypothetical protein UV04_C0003G0073 [Candidatus Gottesmanbacteria bacterium GW2011_GWA2_42_16]KKS51657.1 MAG: hypothetical protein UV17_C0059G0004 [Candidatus Gottesmanbacteria bacterium GW2011_GWA1_42_26]KKS82104.1 MAG: hypothetical protein UV55_C0005G0022 [Candidatus Gottesmanbacteria bacterium GW2011_GWC1_43_10]KKS86619.1 MAG: hypothetical protein UV61_C0008G0072 [Candidatus Gottesmanbacteria bacterium GW2011_GWB1_43_11]OGG09205.1 MAG: hypothetical protein A2699_02465 [Candidatus Go
MRYSRDKDWGEIGLGCLGLLTLIAIATVISAFIMTLVWGWIVPQIFASAVEQGVLPASLTIVQALKLSILFSILGLTGATASSKSKKSSDVGFVGNIVISVVAAIVLLPFWAILVMISGFFISLVWGWVIPDVFNGAVAHNLLPGTLPFWHAVGLSILFSVLGLSSHRASSSD